MSPGGRRRPDRQRRRLVGGQVQHSPQLLGLRGKPPEILGPVRRLRGPPADEVFLIDQIAGELSRLGQLGKLGQILFDRLRQPMLLPAVFEIDFDQLGQHQPAKLERLIRQEFGKRRRPLRRLPRPDQRIHPRGDLLERHRSAGGIKQRPGRRGGHAPEVGDRRSVGVQASACGAPAPAGRTLKRGLQQSELSSAVAIIPNPRQSVFIRGRIPLANRKERQGPSIIISVR